MDVAVGQGRRRFWCSVKIPTTLCLRSVSEPFVSISHQCCMLCHHGTCHIHHPSLSTFGHLCHCEGPFLRGVIPWWVDAKDKVVLLVSVQIYRCNCPTWTKANIVKLRFLSRALLNVLPLPTSPAECSLPFKGRSKGPSHRPHRAPFTGFES